jgi:hypothetical protein
VIPRSVEAVVVAALGSALGAAAGSLVDLPVPGAVVGGLNGLISGRRRIYEWSSAKGIAAFALDSTWALVTTTSALVAHGVAALQTDAGYAAELSERRNRHVYARGMRVRRRFAITLGNVVNGAGDVSRPRRARLVTDHEDVHVWQERWFGPLFPVLYGGWMIGGAVAASGAWIAGRRRPPFAPFVEACAYYLNPFEWWAYSRDDHWPPSGMLAGVGWRRPAVRSFASRRRVQVASDTA